MIGGCPLFRFPLGGEVGGVAALSLVRVGACADELRLMGVDRDELPTRVGRSGRGKGSLSKKMSRDCGPPVIERMWSGLWGGGANCTTQLVESDGRQWARRCFLVGRLVATKGRRA